MKKRCPFGSCSASAPTWAISDTLQPRKCEILVRNHRNYLSVDFLYVCWGTLSIICSFPQSFGHLFFFFYWAANLKQDFTTPGKQTCYWNSFFHFVTFYISSHHNLSIDNLSGKKASGAPRGSIFYTNRFLHLFLHTAIFISLSLLKAPLLYVCT